MNRSPWFPAFLRWDGPALMGRTATDREVRTGSEDTGPTNDRTPPDTSRQGVTADGERASGPLFGPSSSGWSSSRRRAESSSVSKASDTRPSACSSHHIVITSHRAIEDPCHHPHLGRLPTVSHRPVIRREDERAPIGPDLRTSPDGKCSCLPRSPSLPRRRLSL